MNGGMKAHKTRAQIEAEIREHARQMEANAREREQKDMAYLLRKKGYSPHHAAALMKEGMGIYELEERLKDPNDLARTHGFKRKV